jgi:hypothetical protein
MFDYIRAFGRLNRDVKLYLAGSGLGSFAYFGVMGVLFNLYLMRLGFGPEFIGLLIGSGQLLWAVMALPASAIGMRIGLTRALVLAEALAAVGFSLVLLVERLPRPLWAGWLIGVWMIVWLGAALLTVNGVPFVMAVTSSAERAHAFSLHMALSALLGFAGSLVAGWLPGALAGWMGIPLDDPAPYRLALWIAPLGFALAGVLFWAIRPVAVVSKEDNRVQRSGAPIGLFIFFTAMVFLGALGGGAMRAFFNLYLDSELNVTTAQIGAAMAFAQLLPVVVALLTPLVLARLGSGMTQVATAVLSALCIALMGFIPHWIVATAALMGIQATIAMIGPARNLFGQEIVSARWRTTIAALATVGLALAWAAAAAFGGYAIAIVGFSTFFLACSALTLASALIQFVYVWRTNSAGALAPLSQAARLPLLQVD